MDTLAFYEDIDLPGVGSPPLTGPGRQYSIFGGCSFDGISDFDLSAYHTTSTSSISGDLTLCGVGSQNLTGQFASSDLLGSTSWTVLQSTWPLNAAPFYTAAEQVTFDSTITTHGTLQTTGLGTLTDCPDRWISWGSDITDSVFTFLALQMDWGWLPLQTHWPKENARSSCHRWLFVATSVIGFRTFPMVGLTCWLANTVQDTTSRPRTVDADQILLLKRIELWNACSGVGSRQLTGQANDDALRDLQNFSSCFFVQQRTPSPSAGLAPGFCLAWRLVFLFGNFISFSGFRYNFNAYNFTCIGVGSLYTIFTGLHIFIFLCWTLVLKQLRMDFFWNFTCGLITLLLATLALECHSNWFSERFFPDFWNTICTATQHLNAEISLSFDRSGPKSRQGSSLCRGRCLLVLLPLLHSLANQMDPRGEGCVLTMQDTEVPTPFFSFHAVGTKLHGTQPSLCHGTPLRPEAAPIPNKVEERSLKRAYHRSLTQGFAWYKGKAYSSFELEQMGCTAPTCRSQLPSAALRRDWHDCNTRHSAKKRLTIWHWNCGGLSSGRWDEIKAWLHLNCVHIAVFVETRWTFDAEWTDEHWTILHSGEGPGKGKGILVLISKKICPPSKVRWQSFCSGRLVHIRLHLMPRSVDVIACYQHTYQPTHTCLKSREAWWRLLEQVLQGIPNHHSLVLLGDCSCYLAAQSHVSGTDAFHWLHRQHTGTIHSDHARFGHILRNFALTALNTWSSMLGPTYVHGEQGSRLDYICVRQAFADGEARQTKYLWSSPFLDQTTHGHVPMLCTIARYWIPPFAHSIASRVSLQQRQTSREAYVRQTGEWTALTQATQSQLIRLFQRSDLNAHQLTGNACTVKCILPGLSTWEGGQCTAYMAASAANASQQMGTQAGHATARQIFRFACVSGLVSCHQVCTAEAHPPPTGQEHSCRPVSGSGSLSRCSCRTT